MERASDCQFQKSQQSWGSILSHASSDTVESEGLQEGTFMGRPIEYMHRHKELKVLSTPLQVNRGKAFTCQSHILRETVREADIIAV